MDKIDNIGLTRMLTQSYDFDGFTTQEVWSRIAQRMNIIIEHFNYLESTVKDKQELIDKKLDYLINEGLPIEIAKAVKEKIDDGTIKDIVDEQIFTELRTSIATNYNDLNNKITATNTLVNNNTSSINSVKSELLASNEALKNEVDNSIQENIQYTEEKINELLDKVCYVSNVEELKEALKTNKHIKLLEGVYQLTSSLELEEYTTLEGLGKVVIQGNGINNYIRNKTTTETSEYNGASNITIKNIIFDGLNSTGALTLLCFGHAKNIIIEKCHFKDSHTWHMIELNGCLNSIIKECSFENYGRLGTNVTEVIQLDFMGDYTLYPWASKYDNTACNGIIIEKCYFDNVGGTCIGHHSFKEGVRLRNVSILNNTFNNCHICINLNDFYNLIIEGNKANSCNQFFYSLNVNNHCDSLIINNNIFVGNYVNGESTGDLRFITINPSGASIDKNYHNVTITHNDISNTKHHAIGLTASYVTISNNNFKTVAKNGIYLFGGYVGVVSNNTFRDVGVQGDYYGIKIGGNTGTSTERIVCDGNTFANLNSIRIENSINKVIVSNNICSAPISDGSESKATLSNNI